MDPFPSASSHFDYYRFCQPHISVAVKSRPNQMFRNKRHIVREQQLSRRKVGIARAKFAPTVFNLLFFSQFVTSFKQQSKVVNLKIQQLLKIHSLSTSVVENSTPRKAIHQKLAFITYLYNHMYSRFDL